MGKFSKVANAAARTGLLFTGILGLYLSHNKRIPGYMAYVSCYITCIGICAMAHYLLEDEHKESEDKNKQESRKPTTQKDVAGSLASKEKSVLERKISREEFDKEVDKILVKINAAKSENVPVSIGLPNLEHADLDAIGNVDFKKLVELGQVEKEDIILKTAPVEMKVLDVDDKGLDCSEIKPSEYPGHIIDQLRLRQIASSTSATENKDYVITSDGNIVTGSGGECSKLNPRF